MTEPDQLIPHLDPRAGKLTLRVGERVLLQGGVAVVSYRDTRGPRRLTTTTGLRTGFGGDTTRAECRDKSVELEWSIRRDGDGVRLRLSVTNIGKDTVWLDRLDVLALDPEDGGRLDLGTPLADLRVLDHGWQSWSPVYSRRLGDPPPPTPVGDDYEQKHRPHRDDGGQTTDDGRRTTDDGEPGTETPSPVSSLQSLISSYFTILHSSTGALLLGFVTGADQLTAVHLDTAGALAATAYADGVPLVPGAGLVSEELLVLAGDDANTLLTRYAEAGRTTDDRRQTTNDQSPPSANPQSPVSNLQVPTGWCTWYYYFGQNSADDVTRNVEALERLALPIDMVIVDDGFQAALGDWLTPSHHYPTGLTPVAQHIRDSGRQAVLWLAPFGVAHNARVYADHPDWLLRDETGETVHAWTHGGAPVAALDTTHPGVLAWLTGLFTTLARDWDGFKLDFLFAAALPGHRHDPAVTRAQAYRRGLQAIRRAVGDRFLLGCGAPLAPSVGLIDAMRIGPDVAGTWDPVPPDEVYNPTRPGVENALRAVLGRAALHGRWWINDPDCVLVRPAGDGAQLSEVEVHLLATVMALSGGMLLDSDNLTTLPTERVDLLRRLLPALGEGALAPDLLTQIRPERFVLPIERPWGAWTLAAIINWSADTVTREVELDSLGLSAFGGYHVYDYWRDDYLGLLRGRMTVWLPGHGVRLLLFKRPSDHPDLLSTTFHIGQGAVDILDVTWREGRGALAYLDLTITRPARQVGSLILTVPAGWQINNARLDEQPVQVYNRQNGTARVRAEINGTGIVTIECERV